MDGGGQLSIEACSSAGVKGIYPGTQTATQSFVGNDAFRRSATAEPSMFIVRVLPSTALYNITHTDYWLLVHWKLRISLFYDPGIRPTFRARFCRKLCDLYASIYGK